MNIWNKILIRILKWIAPSGDEEKIQMSEAERRWGNDGMTSVKAKLPDDDGKCPDCRH